MPNITAHYKALLHRKYIKAQHRKKSQKSHHLPTLCVKTPYVGIWGSSQIKSCFRGAPREKVARKPSPAWRIKSVLTTQPLSPRNTSRLKRGLKQDCCWIWLLLVIRYLSQVPMQSAEANQPPMNVQHYPQVHFYHMVFMYKCLLELTPPKQ